MGVILWICPLVHLPGQFNASYNIASILLNLPSVTLLIENKDQGCRHKKYYCCMHVPNVCVFITSSLVCYGPLTIVIIESPSHNFKNIVADISTSIV